MQEFVDNLLLDLLENGLGLWEIDRLARKELAHLADQKRSQRAKSLVNDWLARGWVNIFEQPVTYLPGNDAALGSFIRLEPARVAAVLSDSDAWDYEAIQHAPARFFVRLSERGRTQFRDDARRRGLFRS